MIGLEYSLVFLTRENHIDFQSNMAANVDAIGEELEKRDKNQIIEHNLGQARHAQDAHVAMTAYGAIKDEEPKACSRCTCCHDSI